ncbi:MAG: type II toxin-antitoxin system RelE/ParE family toxin [Pseudolabrys sp.]|nr:type II toxin-antitoxin system RelE/ParE family toxin [Pseudolabrys sp.]MCW5696150.1 type II toxin-antitoxin system RelE/ParE family toxin [Bauldia sp.]
MIRTFKSKKLRNLFEKGDSRGLPADQISRIENRLATIEAARRIEDCNVAGYRLHALSGDYKGFHAVWVTGNWRIVFRFVDGDAFDVDHVDYH